MSRNRSFNWERAKAESRLREEHTSGPKILPVRRNSRLDGWVEGKRAQFPAYCSVCGEFLDIGSAVQVKPPKAGRNERWLTRHATCAPPG